jgi:hypothetical protein
MKTEIEKKREQQSSEKKEKVKVKKEKRTVNAIRLKMYLVTGANFFLHRLRGKYPSGVVWLSD